MDSNIHHVVPVDDYVQSANTLFHFVNKEEYLKDILLKQALIPRFCKEDIEYLSLKNNGIYFNEVAILQKCFCDIPLHKLTEKFKLEPLENDDITNLIKESCSLNDTHPDFYGSYGIAFSKSWGEKNNLQPVHYINENSNYTLNLKKTFDTALNLDNIDDIFSIDLFNKLSFIKPLRGVMERTINNQKVKFFKNFHDEKEWRYVPNDKDLDECGISSVLADSDMIKHINNLNNSIANYDFETLWLKFDLSDVRYIIVPDSTSRISLIQFIRDISKNRNDNLKYDILMTKILVLEEIRKDW